MATDSGDLDRVDDRVVITFDEAINRRDLEALGELMTDRHRFVDAGENVLAGKPGL